MVARSTDAACDWVAVRVARARSVVPAPHSHECRASSAPCREPAAIFASAAGAAEAELEEAT